MSAWVRMRASTVLWIALLGASSGIRAEQPPTKHPAWNPEKTWVFAVSTLVWKFDRKLNMEQKGRHDQDLIAALRKRGVPAERIVFLKDQQGTLDNIRRSLVELLKKARKDDMLMFYFQGHGGRDLHGASSRYYFVNFDANDDRQNSFFYMDHVFDAIEKHFKGGSALLMADCCHSGGMVVEARKRQGRIRYACLSSVSAHNGSTGAWTFTQGLIKGFRGDPSMDLNDDGTITLSELNREIEVEMAVIEEQKAAMATVNDFDLQLRLGPAAKKSSAEIGKFVEANQDGAWYAARIEAVKENRVLVSYAGFDEREWIGRERMRPLHPKHLEDGARVLATDEEGNKRRGVVRRHFYGLHLVHFDADRTPSLLDQWLPLEQLKALPR